MTGNQLRTWSAVLFLSAMATPARAQDAREFFFRALGGVTWGTETGGNAGAGVGMGIARSLQLYFEGGLILPESLSDFLEDVFDDEPSGRRQAEGPSFYGLGGLRFQPERSGARPFAEGLLGFARPSTYETFDDDDPPFDLDLGPAEPALALGIGVAIPFSSRTGVEVGYRLTHIFTPNGSSVSQVYGAYRMRW